MDPNAGVGYDPDSVTVPAGSSIIWDNQDNALHTATSGNPEIAVPDGQFDSGMVGVMTQSSPPGLETKMTRMQELLILEKEICPPSIWSISETPSIPAAA
jgi:hypothetical protein